jgi:hypothetical protein
VAESGGCGSGSRRAELCAASRITSSHPHVASFSRYPQRHKLPASVALTETAAATAQRQALEQSHNSVFGAMLDPMRPSHEYICSCSTAVNGFELLSLEPRDDTLGPPVKNTRLGSTNGDGNIFTRALPFTCPPTHLARLTSTVSRDSGRPTLPGME